MSWGFLEVHFLISAVGKILTSSQAFVGLEDEGRERAAQGLVTVGPRYVGAAVGTRPQTPLPAVGTLCWTQSPAAPPGPLKASSLSLSPPHPRQSFGSFCRASLVLSLPGLPPRPGPGSGHGVLSGRRKRAHARASPCSLAALLLPQPRCSQYHEWHPSASKQRASRSTFRCLWESPAGHSTL